MTSKVHPDPRTGKLVRSVVVTSRKVGSKRVAETVVPARTVPPVEVVPGASAAATPPTGIDETVARIAAQQELPPELIHSVIKVESNYDPYAVSSKGALGLMQLIPSTARRFGVSNVFNPVENIQGGVRYLRYLLDLYNGDPGLALAAYNAGEGAVARYGGVPPYRETRNYLLLVKKELEKSAALRPAPKVEQKEATETKPAGPAHIQEVVESDGTVRYVSR